MSGFTFGGFTKPLPAPALFTSSIVIIPDSRKRCSVASSPTFVEGEYVPNATPAFNTRAIELPAAVSTFSNAVSFDA